MKGKAVNKGTWLLFLFLSLQLLQCHGNDPVGNNDFSAEEQFSFTVQVRDHSEFQLKGVAGTVAVNGVAGANVILVTGKKRVESHSLEDAQEYLQQLQVSVQDLTSKIEAKTTQPEHNNGRNYIVDYTVSMPNHLKAVVNHVAGNITIEAIENQVSVNNVSGNVILNDIAGNVFGQNVSGNIEAQAAMPLDGTINLSAVSGNIQLRVPRSSSAHLSANVVSGTISVSDLVLQDLVSTPTSLSGKSGEGRGTISLHTVSGNISVRGF
jgi:hypothetical protein